MLQPLVFVIRSFLLVSVYFDRTRHEEEPLHLCQYTYLFDVPDDRHRILVDAYFQAWSISILTAVIHQFFFNRLVEILFQDPLDF